MSWDNGELIVTASIGIVVFPQQATDVETLLRNATLANAGAKQLGRSRYEIYSRHCEAHSAAQLSLESELHRALARDGLRLLFQPKVNVATGQVEGAEALLRWQHRERGHRERQREHRDVEGNPLARRAALPRRLRYRWIRLTRSLARSGDVELKLSLRRSPSTPLRQHPDRVSP